MEKKIYTDDFEQLLKEKSDQFRMYPSKRVWHSIYNDLHPGRKWPSVAMSMLLTLALLLIGYLNTSDNTITRQVAHTTDDDNNNTKTTIAGNTKIKNQSSPNYRDQSLFNLGSLGSSKEDIANATETAGSSLVKNVDPNSDPVNANTQNGIFGKRPFAVKAVKVIYENNNNNLVQSFDTYIKTNQIFTDVAIVNKKNKKAKAVNPSVSNNTELDTDQQKFADENLVDLKKAGNKESTGVNIPISGLENLSEPSKSGTPDKLNTTDKLSTGSEAETPIAKNNINAGNKTLSSEEKAWIENYAMHNKSPRSKWKGRSAIEFYLTPGVNYRELNTVTKGSATPYANTNINNVVSQKAGLGLGAGVGLSYAFAKNMRIKAGIQFNYTNYRVIADETNHPVLTSLLLNDANTDYSYAATRTSTLSNPYNSSALQLVTVHNTSYQVSIPVGLAFKLATNNNLEWFAGASIQPTYVFGGKAHLISADLRNYISEPSSIRTWNLNTGIETYVNYKLGKLTLQVGPEIRYQLFSTYRKEYTSIEKPYAIGLKIGLVKGF